MQSEHLTGFRACSTVGGVRVADGLRPGRIWDVVRRKLRQNPKSAYIDPLRAKSSADFD